MDNTHTKRLPLVALLDRQGGLTAVERFSAASDSGGITPAPGNRYEHLLPASPLRDGEQLCFEVDLDSCSGCKACVTACHNMNGLEPAESWRRVGTLLGGEPGQPARRQTVTSACHHCLEPGCMTGCPVGAYEKHPVTGIVRHLDDQCIGCRYCLFTCPYDVPRFSDRTGIVRKCDMCSDRLAVGEAPACVQACPTEAIAIRTVETARAVDRAEAGSFLPGAPDPAITVPTTRYRSRSPLPDNTLPADYRQVRRDDSHPPLVFMLVLTQVAAGLFVTSQLVPDLGSTSLIAIAVALAALSGSVFHLGRPQYAFRALVGLRTSWLSREILLFGGFVGLALGYATAHRWASADLARYLGLAAAVGGTVAVYSSVMVYAATRRECWRLPISAPLFFSTALIGGTAVAATVAALAAHGAPSASPMASANLANLAALAALAAAGKLVFEALLLARIRDPRRSALRRRAELLLGPARTFTAARFVTGVAGIAVFALLAAKPEALGPTAAAMACASLIGGELLERHGFFVAAAAPRMPGELP